MNWFVHDTNKTITEEWEHCEHLEVGQSAPYMVGEQDSFGPVARMGMCKECYDKYKEEQEEELEYCYDCGEKKPMKEIQRWTWHDFYPPQGDEPLLICDDCSVKDKHKNRVRRDNEAYEREFDDEY